MTKAFQKRGKTKGDKTKATTGILEGGVMGDPARTKNKEKKRAGDHAK